MPDIARPLPARRPELLIRPLGDRGQYVVKDPRSGAFFHLGEAESFLLTQLDGERTAGAVCAAYAERFGEPLSVLIRRLLEGQPEVKYYVSNADGETPLSTPALVACMRCRVEGFFEDCKSYLGMAQYETRSWVGWHHQMTLVGLAHLFVTLTRKRRQRKLRS